LSYINHIQFLAATKMCNARVAAISFFS
jgi:hypothetical protein